MPYRVYYAGKLIGESALEERDEGMNVLWGRFVATPEYERVREVFDLFWRASDERTSSANDARIREYWRRRDELALEVLSPSGDVLRDRVVHIYGTGDDINDGSLEIELYPR